MILSGPTARKETLDSMEDESVVNEEQTSSFGAQTQQSSFNPTSSHSSQSNTTNVSEDYEELNGRLETLYGIREALNEKAIEDPSEENVIKLSGVEARISNVEKRLEKMRNKTGQQKSRKFERIRTEKPSRPVDPTEEEIERMFKNFFFLFLKILDFGFIPKV